MRPQRPYLLRAFYDWIVDSDCTPHILVDAQRPGLRVPSHAIVDGKVTLNVSPRAVRELLIDEAGLSFQGRFGGSPFAVYVPLNAVVAIYARETGAGTVLGLEPAEGEESPLSVAESPELPDDDPPPEGGGKPTLRVVK
jgi:stringent starvation protein B